MLSSRSSHDESRRQAVAAQVWPSGRAGWTVADRSVKRAGRTFLCQYQAATTCQPSLDVIDRAALADLLRTGQILDFDVENCNVNHTL
jgi:hypothetical protein